jgi:hypothetical protein
MLSGLCQAPASSNSCDTPLLCYVMQIIGYCWQQHCVVVYGRQGLHMTVCLSAVYGMAWHEFHAHRCGCVAGPDVMCITNYHYQYTRTSLSISCPQLGHAGPLPLPDQPALLLLPITVAVHSSKKPRCRSAPFIRKPCVATASMHTMHSSEMHSTHTQRDEVLNLLGPAGGLAAAGSAAGAVSGPRGCWRRCRCSAARC